jgi:hypothetical protein
MALEHIVHRLRTQFCRESVRVHAPSNRRLVAQSAIVFLTRYKSLFPRQTIDRSLGREHGVDFFTASNAIAIGQILIPCIMALSYCGGAVNSN